MKPCDALPGSVWEYTFTRDLPGTSVMFVVLDSCTVAKDKAWPRRRRVLWLYEKPLVGFVFNGSWVNSDSVRIA